MSAASRCQRAVSSAVNDAQSHAQALDIDGTLPLPLFGMAQLMSNQAGGVDRALAYLEKALDKVAARLFMYSVWFPFL